MISSLKVRLSETLKYSTFLNSTIEMIPTNEQKAIFEFVRSSNHHGIIDAVAGSGKTTTIMESTKHVPNGLDLMFCAFNKSISKEIKRKFKQINQGNIKVKTIHALGFDILKSNSERDYQFDDNKYLKLLKEMLDQDAFSFELASILELNDIPVEPVDRMEEKQHRDFFYHFRDKLLDINVKFRLSLNDGSFDKFKEMLLHFGIFKERKAASVTFNEEVELYLKCNNKLLDRGNDLAKRVNIVDYSDMLYLPQYFNLRPQRLFDVVFVDECQDLSLAQIKIALKYVKHEGRIIAVGDPYQSIYGFTGADIESFDRFKRLPEIQPLTLTRCFRCPANIIELAQKFRNDIYADDHRPGKVETIEFHEVIHTVKPNNLIISRTKAPLQKLVLCKSEWVNLHKKLKSKVKYMSPV